MKSLVFKDVNGTINVEFVTDLINSGAENFSVMDIKGATTAWELANIDFKRLPYNLKDFKEFATAHDLKLTIQDLQKSDAPTTLVDFTNEYYGGGLGIDNV